LGRYKGERETRVLGLWNGFLDVTPDGRPGGAYRWCGKLFLPDSITEKFAAEQDRAWGQPTESIQQVLTLQ